MVIEKDRKLYIFLTAFLSADTIILNENDGQESVRRSSWLGSNVLGIVFRLADFKIPSLHSEELESVADFPNRSCEDIVRA